MLDVTKLKQIILNYNGDNMIKKLLPNKIEYNNIRNINKHRNYTQKFIQTIDGIINIILVPFGYEIHWNWYYIKWMVLEFLKERKSVSEKHKNEMSKM